MALQAFLSTPTEVTAAAYCAQVVGNQGEVGETTVQGKKADG